MIKTRVLYIGSAVPLETSLGLDIIQQPLRERYPIENESTLEGIDATVSITNESIQMQYLSDMDILVQFPIASLKMCAAVRCITTINDASGEKTATFVSLNDPLAGGENSTRPALFTAVCRRTQGRKILECHSFVCSSAKDAMNLVKCVAIAGRIFKQGSQIKLNEPIHKGPISCDSASTLNDSAMSPIHGEHAARSVPIGPEFFEPVAKFGYFYCSNKAEVKRYNIVKIGLTEKQNNIEVPTTAIPGVNNGFLAGTPRSGYAPIPPPHNPPRYASSMSAVQPRVALTSPPIYKRLPAPYFRGLPIAQPRNMFYGSPPPMFGRHQWFPPPPPSQRPPHTFLLPPRAPPPPMFAPPIYIRRPQHGSDSGSRSRSSSTEYRDSRSKTPTIPLNGENSNPKIIPIADTSSDDDLIRRRSSPPPTDYHERPRRSERVSRRDEYEYRYPNLPHGLPHQYVPQQLFDFYHSLYQSRDSDYAPFMTHNPHLRSQSMPPSQERSKSPQRKGKKKKTKSKKSKKNKDKLAYAASSEYNRYPVHNDVSTDSQSDYQSESPAPKNVPDSVSVGYQFYPPRDFRHNVNQFMNERNFSKSITEETRLRASREYPTAYELNMSDNKPNSGLNDESEFTLY